MRVVCPHCRQVVRRSGAPLDAHVIVNVGDQVLVGCPDYGVPAGDWRGLEADDDLGIDVAAPCDYRSAVVEIRSSLHRNDTGSTAP